MAVRMRFHLAAGNCRTDDEPTSVSLFLFRSVAVLCCLVVAAASAMSNKPVGRREDQQRPISKCQEGEARTVFQASKGDAVFTSW